MSVVIPGYEIGARIHHSPLITVLHATRLADGQPVVIKTLGSEYPSSQDLAEIRHEYLIAEKLRGAAGVVELYGLEKHGYGNLAMVMQPFGRSLAMALEAGDTRLLALGTFLDLAIKTVEALSSIHQRGIVHKDVVPRNILWDDARDAIRLIDFGISSELSRERQGLALAKRLNGSLPYISPEQTGRMNRDLDYRSDFYSLGITFFELLTGQLPFRAADTLEWIHTHISKPLPSPCDINPAVPKPLADIVRKLTAKNAEDRYQSSFGILADLRECQRQWAHASSIAPFAIGAQDVSERFQVSQKLYGRESDLAALIGLCEKAAQGELQLCLVSGHSGIGKTALVNEINKPIVRQHGFLIQGKFGQLQRNTAYFALTGALRGLVQQVMTESASRLEVWRQQLQDALGANGQLMVDLIPSLEPLIGPQPPVPRLSAAESQNRFQLVFISFLKVFAAAGHPLTIFLDDMQWSDAPTLSLLQRLFASRDLSHLLLICAYRDNEVDAGHPFQLAVSEIEKSHPVSRVELATLSADSVTALVADSLRCDIATARPLGDELFLRTEGNPFFINELLKTLHEDGAIGFSIETGTWTWDMGKVALAGVSSNVVEFVVSRLRKLDATAQELLQLAACIGNTFDLRTLSVISRMTPAEVGTALIGALKSHVIVPLDGNYHYIAAPESSTENLEVNPVYKFQHDRVQQAAYELIDTPRKHAVHLTIGRLMLQHAGDDDEPRLIEIVSHLDEGRTLITDGEERRQLAFLNLRAGVKAHDSSAYEAALRYLEIGRDLLPADAWSTDYQLTKDLHTEYARCAYLTGHYEAAERSIDTILEKALTNLERADMLAIRTRQYATTGRMEESIAAAIQGLGILGLRFSRHPGRLDVWRETLLVKWNLNGRHIAEVADGPTLKDPEKLVAIRLLMEIFPPAFLSGSGTLLPYLVLKSVNICLRHGNCPEAAFAYAAYGMVLCGVLGRPALGYQYGKLAITLNDRIDDLRLKARIIYVYAMFIHHWSNHWGSMTPWFKKGIEAGYQSGDLLYLAYSAQDCVIWDPRLDLETICTEQRKYLTIVRDCEYKDSLDSGTLFLQFQCNLRGLTEDRLSLNDDTFNEQECLDGMRQRKFKTGIGNYHIYKLEIAFAYEDYPTALHHIAEEDRLIQCSMALPQLVRYNLIAFLTFAALCPNMKGAEKSATLRRMRRDLAQMRAWAANCDANFLHLQRLMEAEMARVTGSELDAIPAYTAAIALARQHEFRRDEALANELFAKFHLRSGQDRAAEGYMKAACLLYRALGAERKAQHLEQTYPQLVPQSSAGRSSRDLPRSSSSASLIASTSSGLRHEALDLASVMKAARAISGEIVIDQLLPIFMEILLENAGAQCGVFVTHQKGCLSIVARSPADETAPPLPQDVTDAGDVLPLSILHYVLRMRENVVLDDASQAHRFQNDPYILRTQPKSVICMPVARHRDFDGVVYLENHLTVGAFTEERLEVMSMLIAQASISIENAQLYTGLEAKVRERTRELAATLDDLKRTQSQLVHSEKMAGLGTLVAGVAHEINNPTNFVSLGAASLREDLEEFKALLFGMLGDENDPEITAHFEGHFQRLQSSLGNINEGAVRISTIVRDLRTFSRLDEAERKTVPLVENLESTIRLVRSQYQEGVDFITDYIDNPDIECLPAQLNQVFMNVIVNACQAIITRNRQDSRPRGSVTIRTRLHGPRDVAIAITDDGIGMSEAVRQRLFEPFFTTKVVGEGTGMGMSISYQIVEKHRGRFEIESAEGKGTTVTLILPVRTLRTQ